MGLSIDGFVVLLGSGGDQEVEPSWRMWVFGTMTLESVLVPGFFLSPAFWPPWFRQVCPTMIFLPCLSPKKHGGSSPGPICLCILSYFSQVICHRNEKLAAMDNCHKWSLLWLPDHVIGLQEGIEKSGEVGSKPQPMGHGLSEGHITLSWGLLRLF